MPGLTLPWGDDELHLSVPEKWRVAGIIAPPGTSPVTDIGAEVRRGLSAPIGSPRLRALTRSGMRVVVLIDDATRPTPIAAMLPAVLEELQRAGVSRDALTVMPALGVHRPMRADEIVQRIGPQPEGALQWENHDCDDPDRLVFLGTTARGTPVWINRTVAQADVVVSIGCITPHVIASFSGGYKNLIPGVAGRETVARNHALNCTPATCNMVGQPIARNPMRLDLEEGGRLLQRPVFIVNAVLDAAAHVTRIVCGDPVAAHRDGAQTCAEACGMPIATRADVVIVASHPSDHDLRQGVKALANTIGAVRPGGVQITFARSREGVGDLSVANHPLLSRAAKLLAPQFLRLTARWNVLGLNEDDRFFLYFALQAMRHTTHVLYAPTVPAGVRAGLPFVSFAESPAAALRTAARRCVERAEVLVFPHGGMTYPVPAAE